MELTDTQCPFISQLNKCEREREKRKGGGGDNDESLTCQFSRARGALLLGGKVLSAVSSGGREVDTEGSCLVL